MTGRCVVSTLSRSAPNRPKPAPPTRSTNTWHPSYPTQPSGISSAADPILAGFAPPSRSGISSGGVSNAGDPAASSAALPPAASMSFGQKASFHTKEYRGLPAAF